MAADRVSSGRLRQCFVQMKAIDIYVFHVFQREEKQCVPHFTFCFALKANIIGVKQPCCPSLLMCILQQQWALHPSHVCRRHFKPATLRGASMSDLWERDIDLVKVCLIVPSGKRERVVLNCN